MPKPKISLVGGGAYSTTGGIQAVNRILADVLQGAGVLRLAYFRNDGWHTILADHAEAASRLPLRLFDGRAAPFVGSVLQDGLRGPGDAWLITHLNYLPLGVLAALCRPGRLAVMLHAAELDEKMGRLKRLLLRRATRVIAVSQFTRRKAEALGVPARNIEVMHHGLDFEGAARPVSVQAGEPGVPVKFLFVGRMDERYKGQMELLDAAELLKTRSVPLEINLVGGGHTLETWRDEAGRRGLDQMTKFHGWVSAEGLQKHYREADVFVMPSQNEGFGLVYAEAMACGLPCISSNVDAAREVVRHGETGFCVPFANSTALAGAMLTLIQDPALRWRMGEAGRARYEQHFTAAAFAHRFLEMLGRWGWIQRSAEEVQKGSPLP